MGAACCGNNVRHLFHHTKIESAQRVTLIQVLMMSVLLAIVELGGAYFSRSSGILADALQVFGHIIMASLSLFAVSRGKLWKTRAALVKGLFMVTLAILSLVGALSGFFSSIVPESSSMGFVGIFAFICNLVCLVVLWRQREDDLNMRSIWLCAANDLLIDLGIVFASIAVHMTHLGWPDSLIGTLFSLLVLWSSLQITRQSYVATRIAFEESSKKCESYSKIQPFLKPLAIKNVELMRFESMNLD